jgi:glycosyltransferase involved in cell wall biosynthesis
MCLEDDIATLLYIREVATFGHFEGVEDVADGLVANAASLARHLHERGYSCPVIPSLIDTSRTEVDSDRTVVLLVNPIATHGIDFLWPIARRLPDIPFLVQESWPLDASAFARLESVASALPNVEIRRRIEPGPDLYKTARVVLVPHGIDNRPRVIAEAQSNAIPVIVSDQPGLVEAVGPGGVVLSLEDTDRWCREIRRLWTEPTYYAELSRSAAAHARRPEIDPVNVVGCFERAAAGAVEACRNRIVNAQR